MTRPRVNSGMRRPARDRRGRPAPGAQTAQSILGANLLAEWDARYLTGIGTWTDTVGGRVATGSGSPALATDGANFNGLPVWTFVAASSQKLDTGTLGANIFVSGAATFYCSLVARASDLDLVDGRYLELTRGVAAEVLQFRSAPTGWVARLANLDSGGAAIDLNVNLWEFALNASGIREVWKNGTSLGTAGVAATLNDNVDRVCFGGFPSGVAFADCRIARCRLCTSLPSVADRAALRALDQQIWGVP